MDKIAAFKGFLNGKFMTGRISGQANPMTAEARRTYSADIAERDRLVFEAFAAGYIGRHVLNPFQRRFSPAKIGNIWHEESDMAINDLLRQINL